MTKVKKSSMLLSCLLLAALVGLLAYIDGSASNYIVRITRLCAINIVLALSMNLVQGFTGIFSLGHAGFMAIGAYTTALLTIGFIVEGSAIEAAGVLSVVSFTFTGCAFGAVLFGGKKRKNYKQRYRK